jgi:predicted nuclease of predicted toxin-antitoxin system
MWLLDVNLPNGLRTLLQAFGIACDTTARRGWRELTNGELVAAASAQGFRVVLTRDRGFGASARTAIAPLPDMAVVVVTIPQAREASYPEVFETGGACIRLSRCRDPSSSGRRR